MPRVRSRQAAPATRERKKKGPKPFPGTRRKRCDLRVPPCEGIKRVMTRHPKKRKTQVLQWLLSHRIPEQRRGPSDLYHAVRSRSGEALISYEEMRDRKIVWEKGGTVYRTPTYHDAEKFWHITAGTIVTWWQNKDKYLPAEEIERIKKQHPLTGCSYDPIPDMPTSRPRHADQQPAPPADGASGSQTAPIEIDDDLHADAAAEEPDPEPEPDMDEDEDEDEDDDDDDDDIDIDIDDNNDHGEDEDEGEGGGEDEEGDDTEVDEGVDDIENSEEFRELEADLEDALGEYDPDVVAQATCA